MAENSKIAWTDHTFNPWIGCTKVSAGCANCYAENLMDKRYHKVNWGPGQPRKRTKTWNDPVKWNRQAEAAGVRQKVFCASLADWLDPEVPAEWLAELLQLIEECEWLDWLMLTKRPERALEDPVKWFLELSLPNVWFGVSAENQVHYDERVAVLQYINAAIRWVSYEPALDHLRCLATDEPNNFRPEWLVIGGESSQSGPARPFHLEWATDAIIRCRQQGIIPFMKQVGSNAFTGGKPFLTKDKAGADMNEWPENLRVREWPASLMPAAE